MFLKRLSQGHAVIGFAIRGVPRRLGAAYLRRYFHQIIADIGSDLHGKSSSASQKMIKKNPGVIADGTGDHAGDSVGPGSQTVLETCGT